MRLLIYKATNYLMSFIQRVLPRLLMKFWALIAGYSLNRCKFFGLPLFRFYPGSLVRIGKSCQFRSLHRSNLIGINHPCIMSTFHSQAELHVGDNCGFSGTTIGVFRKVVLGKNVRCGANTVISDGDWHQDDSRSGEPKPITIHDNVWLGLNVIVLKGVTIGENSVIGAGSVVTKDIPANVIAAGNPCRVVRSIQGK